jgi:hypothetical protein
MMPISKLEREVIGMFAEKLPESARTMLLSDLANASVIERRGDGACTVFELANYCRPSYVGQDTYGLDGKIIDADGATLDVILYCDQERRLLELELIRWDEQPIISPNIATLKIY